MFVTRLFWPFILARLSLKYGLTSMMTFIFSVWLSFTIISYIYSYIGVKYLIPVIVFAYLYGIGTTYVFYNRRFLDKLWIGYTLAGALWGAIFFWCLEKFYKYFL